MSFYAIMLPVKPGHEKEIENFIHELETTHRADHADRLKRLGIRRERGFLQRTPEGSQFVVVFDTDSPASLTNRMKNPRGPFDMWFTDKLREIFDFDPQAMPDEPNELLEDWSSPQATDDLPTVAFAAPIVPGQLPAYYDLVDQMLNEKADEFTEQAQRCGIRKEMAWVQHMPDRDVAIIAHQSDGFKRLINVITNSNVPIDRFLVEHIEKIHGVPVSEMPNWQEPKMMFDWDTAELARQRKAA